MAPFEKPSHAGAAVAAEFIASMFTGEDVREARLRATRMARVADGLPADPAFATNTEFWRYIAAVCAPVGHIPNDMRVFVVAEVYRWFSRSDKAGAFPVFMERVGATLTPAQIEELREMLPTGALVPPPAAIVFPRVAFEA